MASEHTYWRNRTDGAIVQCGGRMSDDWERLSATEGKRLHRAQCVAELRAMLKPGQTVYCTLRSVSRSGMQRRISLHVVSEKGELVSLDWFASRVMGERISDQGGLIVNGCGMDMGFHLVYNLGRAVWPDGTPEPHGSRNGAPDRDGGYALKHSWI